MNLEYVNVFHLVGGQNPTAYHAASVPSEPVVVMKWTV